MITKELAAQVRSEVERLKEEGDKFFHTYQQLCHHNGEPGWEKKDAESVFHKVRKEVIPIMTQAGMDDRSVQALCAWAEKRVMVR
jgi:hypothetical protein